LGQAHKCGGLRPVDEIPTLLITEFPTAIHINTHDKKTCLPSKRSHTITKINDDKHEQYKAGSMNENMSPLKKTTYYHKNK
jgi:hypothetical protein